MSKISVVKVAMKIAKNWKEGKAFSSENTSVRSSQFSEEYYRMKYQMFLKDNKK